MLSRVRGQTRLCSITPPPTIEWEELTPAPFTADVLEEEFIPEKIVRKRFYVPPPFTDDQLLNLSSKRIQDLPRSRVVWALGRFGFSRELRRSDSPIPQQLLARSVELIDEFNTRDMVRVMQAIAYCPRITDPEPIFTLRREICSKIENVSDLFFVSLLFGHLKLVGRLDWTPTANCNRTSQFFLSELIHRKAKIDAARFLEITAALITNERVRTSHTDSVNVVLKHATEESLKHVKSASVLEVFGKAISEIPNQTLFTQISTVLERKFSKEWKSGEDALRMGFYFFINELMSWKVVVAWLGCLRKASVPLTVSVDCEDVRSQLNALELSQMIEITKIVLEQRNQISLVDSETNDWLTGHTFASVGEIPMKKEPIVGAESLHVGSVIRRMVQHTTAEGIRDRWTGPFHVSAAVEKERLVIEWQDQAALEPPHRRGLATIVMEIRRKYLEKIGWKLLLLNRDDFKTNGDLEKINLKFKEAVERVVDKGSVVWSVKPVDLTSAEKTIRVLSPAVSDDQTLVRTNRRESNSRQARMKGQLKSISKQFRKRDRMRARRNRT